jgi:hypothetical protein
MRGGDQLSIFALHVRMHGDQQPIPGVPAASYMKLLLKKWRADSSVVSSNVFPSCTESVV